MKLRLLDLFSGIGGFSLGLERSGYFETVQFCEIDPYCRRVLAKHWPKVPCHDDVRTLDISRIDGRIDAICGGFPCQDISVAGTKRGIESNTRSGLWSEILRTVRDARPRYVIVENVANLLAGPRAMPGAWFGRVLGDLAGVGYDAEWRSIRASEFGLPHGRDRVWIVAYPHEIGRNSPRVFANFQYEIRGYYERSAEAAGGWRQLVTWLKSPSANSIWEKTDREAARMDDGVSAGLDRPDIMALGNAVVPLIPQAIGRAIGVREAILRG